MKLPVEFYLRDDVVKIARELIGKVIFTNFNNEITAGVISETEAYAGAVDKASHAWNNRRTARTEVMFQNGGISYVYLCYGMHHLFNVVTAQVGVPNAVLLRGIHPLKGLAVMENRRNMSAGRKTFADGPGKASQALGITTSENGTDLQSERIWIEDHGFCPEDSEVLVGPRIGVEYAGEDAKLPYRFVLKPDYWAKKKP